jgi:phospholipid transport system substrate-binding protein
MNTKIKFILLVAISMLMTISSSANETEVKKFVAGFADDIISIVKHRSATNNSKADKLFRIVTSTFDTEWMGRFALGRDYRKFSSSEKSKYHKLYNLYLRNTYFPILMKYEDESYSVNRVTQTGTNLYNISVVIVRPGRSPIDLDYTVKQKGNRYKMLDMSIEGVSTVFTQKSEFGSVLSRNGVEGLFESLSRAQINGT